MLIAERLDVPRQSARNSDRKLLSTQMMNRFPICESLLYKYKYITAFLSSISVLYPHLYPH